MPVILPTSRPSPRHSPEALDSAQTMHAPTPTPLRGPRFKRAQQRVRLLGCLLLGQPTGRPARKGSRSENRWRAVGLPRSSLCIRAAAAMSSSRAAGRQVRRNIPDNTYRPVRSIAWPSTSHANRSPQAVLRRARAVRRQPCPRFQRSSAGLQRYAGGRPIYAAGELAAGTTVTIEQTTDNPAVFTPPTPSSGCQPA